MSVELFMENTETAVFNWKKACNGNKQLFDYLNANVVHDEFCARVPDADDVAWAQEQLAKKPQLPSFFEQDKTKILPAAPDGPVPG